MKTNGEWKDYRLIATGGGEKLECYGGVTVLRPDPQVIWKPAYPLGSGGVHAVYHRSGAGGGSWETMKKIPEKFYTHWRGLTFELKLMNFKHVGIFPEQAVNWARMTDKIRSEKREIKVLNLFGYTGGATVACIAAGARVCHVDAARAMCDTAKTNCALSNVDMTKARFIVDDCIKFVEKEIRRGKKYDAVIMDPPSYGRGPGGETWKIEDGIFDLVKLTKEVMSDNPSFYLINSYTTGLQPTVMKNILDIVFKDIPHGVDADEIGIDGEDGITLPCGCSAFSTF
jgi:23S rRNA (cytosine1962-C5)-methyltransferase